MLIRHPLSFWLAVTAIVIMATLSVAWNVVHVGLVMLDVILICALREAALKEGRSELTTTRHGA